MAVATIVATGPAELVRSHPVTVDLVLVDDADATVTPTSWTVALQRNGQTAASDSGTGAVSWEYTAPTTLALGDEYLLEWVITLSDGSTLPYRQSASVCRAHLYPTIRPSDLIARYPRLSATSTDPLLYSDASAVSDMLMDQITTAWRDILDHVRMQGNRSHRVLSPWDLRSALTERALYYVFSAVASAFPEGDYDATVERHREAYAAAMAALSVDYAPDEAATAGTRRSTRAPLFAGGAAAGAYYDYQRDLPQRGTR